jgi:hypothetical protein
MSRATGESRPQGVQQGGQLVAGLLHLWRRLGRTWVVRERFFQVLARATFEHNKIGCFSICVGTSCTCISVCAVFAPLSDDVMCVRGTNDHNKWSSTRAVVSPSQRSVSISRVVRYKPWRLLYHKFEAFRLPSSILFEPDPLLFPQIPERRQGRGLLTFS